MVKIPDTLVTENASETFCNSLCTNTRDQPTTFTLNTLFCNSDIRVSYHNKTSCINGNSPVMHYCFRMKLWRKCIEGFFPVKLQKKMSHANMLQKKIRKCIECVVNRILIIVLDMLSYYTVALWSIDTDTTPICNHKSRIVLVSVTDTCRSHYQSKVSVLQSNTHANYKRHLIASFHQEQRAGMGRGY